MCDKETEERVHYALQHHDISNYKIEVEGRTGKGDCYLSDVTFVKVTGKSKSGAEKTLNLAVKATKENKKLREVIPVRKCFLKEIFIYNVVKVHFEKLLQEKEMIFRDIMPYCYNTRTEENTELIVFENLRPQGYQVWDRTMPWTFEQARLVLEAYGFWHSLSIAFKILKPEIFKEIIRDNVNMFSYFINKSKLIILVAKTFEKARSKVIGNDDQELLKGLQFSEDDVKYTFSDLYFEDPDYHVILHGDCWNNNFMFKYLENGTNPFEVRILDWQCSGLGSPVFDLSHFIYCCCDTGKHPDIKEFLEIYYNSFSKHLSLLGCDPGKVFQFGRLMEHWKKFSRFGMFMSCIVIRTCLMDQQDVPEFAEIAGKDEEDMEKSLHYPLTDEKTFVERMRNNFIHYCRNSQ